jgi:hypothetical protein
MKRTRSPAATRADATARRGETCPRTGVQSIRTDDIGGDLEEKGRVITIEGTVGVFTTRMG